MIRDDDVVTVVVDEYYLSANCPNPGHPYLPEIDAGLIEMTGRAHHLIPPEIVRLELPEGRWAIFDEHDALVLTGPTGHGR